MESGRKAVVLDIAIMIDSGYCALHHAVVPL